MKKLPSLQEIKRELAERSLAEFTKQAWEVIEPGTDFIPGWHIDCISEHLEAVTCGQILRLVITMPPRYMKSINASVMWPVWSWIKKPESRWVFTSYSQLLSNDLSRKRRNIIQSNWFQENWGSRFEMAGDQNVKSEFSNDVHGTMLATSVGGSVLGKGGDFIVIDDPINALKAEADSEATRKEAVSYCRYLTTRLNNKKTGAIICVMQRLHEKDPAAFLIDQGYYHLNLPGEAEGKTIITFPMSGIEKAREDGEPLWQEREGKTELEQVKTELGSRKYAAQYQQRPSPAEGGIFKRTWFKYWRELPEGIEIYIQSWDLNFKDEKKAKSGDTDYVAGGVFGKKGAQKFLIDIFRAKVGFTGTVQAIHTMTGKHAYTNGSAKIVEDKANGPAIIEHLEREIPGLIAVNPKGGKVARANAASPTIEAGNFFIPDPSLPGKEWVHDYIEEFAIFPNGAHDDQVDMTTQALIYLDEKKIEFQSDTVDCW